MKLDKKYIIDKVDKLIYSIDWEWNSPNEKIFEEIIMSIVRDSYNAGAEAQKIASIKSIRPAFKEWSAISIDDAIYTAETAISSATVTFEEGK